MPHQTFKTHSCAFVKFVDLPFTIALHYLSCRAFFRVLRGECFYCNARHSAFCSSCSKINPPSVFEFFENTPLVSTTYDAV